jgi:hypothetical protein
MPSFSTANVTVEVAPNGGVRVRSVTGGRFWVYPDITSVLAERPPWLDEGLEAQLTTFDPKALAEQTRYVGSRPDDMPVESYRALDRRFGRYDVFDERSQAIEIRGTPITSSRFAAQEGVLFALPGALSASANTPQFAYVKTSVTGLPVFVAAYPSISEAVAELPEAMRIDALRNFAAVQARFASSLGRADAVGMQRWIAHRATGRDTDGLEVTFDGEYRHSKPFGTNGLLVHEFALTPRPENGMATIARVIGEPIDFDANEIPGVHSTLALVADHPLLEQLPPSEQHILTIEGAAIDEVNSVARDHRRRGIEASQSLEAGRSR